MTAILVALTALFFIGINILSIRWAKRRAMEDLAPAAPHPFAEVHFPCGLFLCRNHAWARLADSGELKVGADELITQALGGADRIELPKPGTSVRRGDPLATVWRLGKRLTIPSPASGTVVHTNEALRENPSAFGLDPYGLGWLVTLWPVEHMETLKELKVGERASKWLEREVARFTEFLSHHTAPPLLQDVLPDGAHPIVGSALTLGDGAWKEFQREFLTTPEL